MSALTEALRERTLRSLPLTLYVHYPFCRRKCPYCDFFSVVKPADAALDTRYAQRLAMEFKALTPFLGGRHFEAVFIGGGTPSLITPDALALLLDAVEPYLRPDTEITLEMNPGSVNREGISALLSLGINRVSLGCQSFNDRLLKVLGRIHDREAIFRAVDALAGRVRLNLDIMHSLPGQSLEEAIADLQTALDLEPEHLSWYELTLEEGTPFYDHPPAALPDEDLQVRVDEAGFSLLDRRGYRHYEVSAFTRDRVCTHNVNYWRFGDYVGLGAGAHGKLSTEQGLLRSAYADDVTAFLKGEGPAVRLIPREDVPGLAFEYFLNRLRLYEPLSFAELAGYTGLSPEEPYLKEKLKALQAEGLLTLNAQGLALTARGQRLLNDVLITFLPEE